MGGRSDLLKSTLHLFDCPHKYSRLFVAPCFTLIYLLILPPLYRTCAVMSSNSFLNALGAMDLSQMCVQAVWDSDSALRQIPYFEQDVISRCRAAGVETVYDIMELEDEQRNDLLKFDDKQM